MAGNEVARVYAASLVEIGDEKDVLSQLEEELGFVSGLMKEDKYFKEYLISPSFSQESKKEFLKKVFSGKLSDYIVKFLRILIENDRQSAIGEIHESMVDLIDIANNRQRVTVITRDKLDDVTVNKIQSDLKAKLNKEIILTEKVDESILGGIIIKIGDLVVDGSLAKGLKNIRNTLLNSKVRSEVAYED